MGDVLAFTPRPSVAAPVEPAPMTEAEIRTRLGEALQTALDAADHIIAVLDRMDGDVDAENGGDAEPALATPENHHESQVVWLRGNDEDREADAPVTMLPIVPAARMVISSGSLRWGGKGNVLTAAGVAFLDMVAGR